MDLESKAKGGRVSTLALTIVLCSVVVALALFLPIGRHRSTPTTEEPRAALPEPPKVEQLVEPVQAVAIPSERDAWKAWADREYTTAASMYAARLNADPQSFPSAYMLGLASWKSGELDTARDAMHRAIEIDAHAVRAFVNLSRIENDRRDPSAALDAADRAIALAPEDPTAIYQRARSLRNLGRVDDAVASLTECLGRRPDYGHALNLLGLIHLDRGESGPAVDAFESAAALEPSLAYLQRNLGLALDRAGRTEEALVAYQRAAEIEAGAKTQAVETDAVAVAAVEPSPAPTEAEKPGESE
jgi:tetratricopeptide (TPR) repeat protein